MLKSHIQIPDYVLGIYDITIKLNSCYFWHHKIDYVMSKGNFSF